jgi:uncharacterized protein (TIGR00369 family)
MKHNFCFVCSQNNQKGLKVRFKQNGKKVVGTFIPQKEHQSYDGITHGGILVSLADAAMNRALLKEGFSGKTAKLEIRFFHSAQIGSPLKVVGEVIKIRKKSALAKGGIFSSTGSKIISSKGIFILN